MTQDNLFREVDEDMERQRLEAWWKSYGSFVIAAVLAVVIGTAAHGYWQNHMAEMHQKATGELAAILIENKADPAKKIEALQQFAAAEPGQTQATIAEFHAAAEAARDGNKDGALKIYDGIAADAKADHAFRQLADLFAVQQQIDTGDAALLQARLQPLMADKEPWRFSAKELSAYLSFRSGDKAKARETLTALTEDAAVPTSINARAALMLRLLEE